MIKCSNCKDDFELNQPGHFILEYTADATVESNDTCDVLCSLSCLTEFAWKLREAQPKLSKSNQDPQSYDTNAWGDPSWPTDY